MLHLIIRARRQPTPRHLWCRRNVSTINCTASNNNSNIDRDLAEQLDSLRIAANPFPFVSFKEAIMTDNNGLPPTIRPEHVPEQYNLELMKALVSGVGRISDSMKSAETQMQALQDAVSTISASVGTVTTSVSNLKTSMQEFVVPESISQEEFHTLVDTMTGFNSKMQELRTAQAKSQQKFEDRQQRQRIEPAPIYSEGPTDRDDIRAALASPASIDKALVEYGPEWALGVKPHWTSQAMRHKTMQKVVESHEAGTLWGTPGASMLRMPDPAHNSDAHTHTHALRNHLASPSESFDAAKAGAGTPSNQSAPSLGTLPFGAMLGKHVKFEFHKPAKFSQASADFDVPAYLSSLEEYLMLTGTDRNAWGLMASTFLDKNPRKLWDAHKVQAAAEGKTSELYGWDHFKGWFSLSFTVRDVTKTAFQQIVALRQTKTVADYKVDFDVLAAKADIPMHLRVSMWEQGLKSHIKEKVLMDPLTHSEYTDIAKAQQAALQYDLIPNAPADAAVPQSKKRNYAEASQPSYFSSSPLAATAKPFTPRRGIPIHSYVDCKIQNGRFDCPPVGTCKRERIPDFMIKALASMPRNKSDGPLLPDKWIKHRDQRARGGCFVNGCTEDHTFHVCAKLAHNIWNDRNKEHSPEPMAD